MSAVEYMRRPYKPRDPTLTSGVISAAASSMGGVKALAGRIHKSKSQVARYTEDASPDSKAFTLDQARELTKAGCLEFVFDLCALAGGGFMPGKPMSNDSLASLAGKCGTETAQAVAVVLELPQGPMSRENGIRLLREIQDIDRITAALKARVFADMQQKGNSNA